MRIAQVAPLFESVPPARYGGTERVVFWLTEELIRRGHDLTLFASADSRTAARLSPVLRRALRLSGSTIADASALHAVAVKRAIETTPGFDLIHAHVDWVGPALASFSRSPLVTTLHGRLDVPEARAMAAAYPEAPLIAISSSQRSGLPHANWAGTIHHGLPLESVTFQEDKGGYLLFVGRISREKRPDLAVLAAHATGLPLRIAAKVKGNAEDCAYWQDELLPLLTKYGEHVELIGEVGEERKRELMAGARALLFPTDWPEPFGLVAIESSAAGTPVIAFPNGALPEIVEHGRNGFLVQSLDEMIEAIRSLDTLDHRECREVVRERFTVARMADDYETTFHRLARTDSTALSPTGG
jgi:glycosyltransferase involved in cell wall biosynthesis